MGDPFFVCSSLDIKTKVRQIDNRPALRDFIGHEARMNAHLKPKAKAPARPTGKKPSAEEMIERAKTRWPKTMACLAE